jgi:hypothetical protein
MVVVIVVGISVVVVTVVGISVVVVVVVGISVVVVVPSVTVMGLVVGREVVGAVYRRVVGAT